MALTVPMRKPPPLKERLSERLAAQERTRVRIAQIRLRTVATRAVPRQRPTEDSASTMPVQAPVLSPSLVTLRASLVTPRLLRQNDGAELRIQPWAADLVSTLLERAQDRRVSIRLLWPAEIDSLAGLHAIASLSCVLQKNLTGLRTVLYPGTRTTWTALDRLAVDRRQLQLLWRSLHDEPARVASASFTEVLATCNDIELYNIDASPPQLRQLIPAFIYDPAQKAWADPKHLPLDRLICKVLKARRRDILRANILPEWRNAAVAPGALLVLPRGTKRKEVKRALAHAGLSVRTGVLLLDARTRSAIADPYGVSRLPEFLKNLYEDCGSSIGALIVTDDPSEYFVLRHRLEQAGLQPDSAIVAGESEPDRWLASETAKAIAWQPAIRSMINFSVTVLDQPAAMLARRFGRIAEAVRDEGSSVEELFRLAQAFVMRASHVPGGFADLHSEETEEHDYLSRDLQWNRIEVLIRQALTRGDASEQRAQIDDAICRVHKHLADCENATPLALKLQEQVQRFAVDSRDGLTIVLSSPRHIALAQRFLVRVLGDAWAHAHARIEWLTLARAPAELSCRSRHRRLVIVGLSPRILRLLATHTEIPTGTCLLVPAQKALGVTPMLRGLAAADALKPYRARLSGLLATLNKCLDEIPEVEVLTRSLKATAMSPARMSIAQAADPAAYRFHLEDGRCIYATSTVFRYDGAEEVGFKRAQARSIEPGDLIFEMSDELRDEIEQAITPTGGVIESSPARKVLVLYHSLVRDAVSMLFPAPSKQASLRGIKASMVALDPDSADISLGKLSYWISLTDDERTPHSARDPQEFLLFCQVLGIDEGLAKTFWERVRRVRFENQAEGRQLKAIYAEILFSPQSAQVYRRLSPEVIRRLQTKALDCIFHVTEVDPPRSNNGAEKT